MCSPFAGRLWAGLICNKAKLALLGLLAWSFISGPAIAACAQLTLSYPELKRPALFGKGQRVACIGDSITRPGQYVIYLYDYYVTRFPDSPIRLFNFGIGGDTMKDALIRYENDIRAVPCDTALLLLGMNDAFRAGYGPGSETPSILARRKATAGNFDQQLTTMLNRLRADGVQPILLTPTCYDETSLSKSPVTPGGNQGLLALTEVIKSHALSEGLPLVELNRPLLAAQTALQSADPKYSLISADRIHPLESGQAVMAWAILRQQNAPAEVATVEIAVPSKTVRLACNCEVTDLRCDPGEVSFSYRPAALPLPYDKGLEAASQCIPLTQDLNQEILRVRGLAAGQWTLTVGDVKVGAFPAGDLDDGINLATLADSPQLRAARAIHELNLKRNKIETSIRGIHYLEKVMKIPGPVPESVWREKIAAYRASADYQKLPPTAYYRSEADQYVEKKTHEKELYETLEQATASMYAAFPKTAWKVRLVVVRE